MSCWSIHVKRFAPVLLDASEASFFLYKKKSLRLDTNVRSMRILWCRPMIFYKRIWTMLKLV
jgi:hypothetical protein